jgi:SAM-dependent methyltransferase
MSNSTANHESSALTYWHEGLECCDAEWEAAYARFETPDEEVAKFTSRFHKLGVNRLPRDLLVVNLFCGRGNGLQALERLGFSHLEGVDLSPSLMQQYGGSAKLYVADCRALKFESDSKDLMIVQGGLHHLPTLPADLEGVLSEVQRVLKSGGRFMVVEPWLTPFLRGVHAACNVIRNEPLPRRQRWKMGTTTRRLSGAARIRKTTPRKDICHRCGYNEQHVRARRFSTSQERGLP